MAYAGNANLRWQPALYAVCARPNNRPLADAAKLLDDPGVRGAWHRFIEALVARYRANVKVWEIWNEPNSIAFWKTETSPAQYGRLVKDAAAIIRHAQPNAVVLAGSTAGVSVNFLEGFLASDGANWFDHWSVHPYGEVPEEQDAPIRRLQEYLRSRGKSPVIWQSECGFPSSGDTAGWGFGDLDETKHAKWVLRRMLSDVALGARVSIYFVLTDYPAALEGGPDRGKLGINRKGLYAAGSWKPKPAAYAYRYLAALVHDRLTIKPLVLHFQVLGNGTLGTIASENIRTLTFIDTNTRLPVVVYWLPVAMQTEMKPASIRLPLRPIRC